MSFKKISLFSLIILTRFTHIIAMELIISTQPTTIEKIQQSIQKKLSILDNQIVTMQTKIYYTIRKQTSIQNSLTFHQSRI
jgi:peptidoglycan hydrolase CwlO-like protein